LLNLRVVLNKREKPLTLDQKGFIRRTGHLGGSAKELRSSDRLSSLRTYDDERDRERKIARVRVNSGTKYSGPRKLDLDSSQGFQ